MTSDSLVKAVRDMLDCNLDHYPGDTCGHHKRVTALLEKEEEPGPFPGKMVPLDQIEKDLKEAKKVVDEKYKVNAWHKPSLDDIK